MAIRKFRKQLKPFIWIITTIFILSSGALYYGQVKNSDQSEKEYAFKLNGKKIAKVNIERIKANITSAYSQNLGFQLEPELVGVIAVEEEINKNLTLVLADQMKVKVSSKEINEEYKNIKASVGDDEQFKRVLAAQVMTRAVLKKEIEDNMKINKLITYIQKNIKVSDQELEKYFNENRYARFAGKDLASNREEIQNSYTQERAIEEYYTQLEKMKKDMKIEDVNKAYEKEIPKIEKTVEGVNITNGDMAKNILISMIQEKTDLVEAKKNADLKIEKQIKLVKEAESKGVKIDADSSLEQKIRVSGKGLFEVYKQETNPSTKEIEEFFKNNKKNYDKEANITAEVAVISFKPSEADKKIVEKQAKELLKTVTKENFAEKAKEMSEDKGSALNGGDLGWFTQEVMVEPFAKAAFKATVGEIYPSVVETDFGYHIIYVKEKKVTDGKEEVSAAHILLMPKVSEATKNKELETINGYLKDLKTKSKTVEQLKEKDKNIVFAGKIEGITENGYIPNLGYDANFVKAIFEAPINEYAVFSVEDRTYIFGKIKDEKTFVASLTDENIKNRVIEELKIKKASEKMSEIMK